MPVLPFRPKRLSVAVLAALLAVAGVAAPAPSTLRPAFAQEAMVLPTDPAKLIARTSAGEFSFSLEIADEEGERQRGLMFRKDMAPDHGMLFDFGSAQAITMWMKNTPMSLDMVFVRADGTVASIAERTRPFSEATVASEEPVPFVLELRAGVTRLIGLKPGDRLTHPVFDK